MSTIAKKRNIFSILFSSEIDVENYEDVVLPKELADARIAREKYEKEVEKGFNSGKSSKGGIAPKMNPDTEKAMRAMHSKVAKRETKTVDREIGD